MTAVFIFLLFFLQFIIFPFGISPFETAKVFLAEGGILILIILFLTDNKKISLRKQHYFVIFIILCGIQLVIEFTPALMWGNVFRLQGMFLYLLLFLFALLSSTILLPKIEIKVIVGICIVQLLAALFIETKSDFRAIGTLGEANALAAAQLFLVPFLLPLRVKGKMSWLRLSAFIILCSIILISGSRSGIIGLVLEVLYFYSSSYKNTLALTVIAILFLASLTLPFLSKNVYENRADVWKVALSAGYKKPLFGWGIGNIEQGLKKTALNSSNVLSNQQVDSSHNLFLDWWVQGGIIGLGLFLAMISGTFRTLYLTRQKTELTILIGLITVLAFNPASIVSLIQLWWIIGQGIKA